MSIVKLLIHASEPAGANPLDSSEGSHAIYSPGSVAVNASHALTFDGSQDGYLSVRHSHEFELADHDFLIEMDGLLQAYPAARQFLAGWWGAAEHSWAMLVEPDGRLSFDYAVDGEPDRTITSVAAIPLGASTPVSVERVGDVLTLRVGGSSEDFPFDKTIRTISGTTDDAVSASCVVSSAELKQIVTPSINLPDEAVDVAASLTAGTVKQVLVTAVSPLFPIELPPDEVTASSAVTFGQLIDWTYFGDEVTSSSTINSGVLTSVLQTYNNWPLEEINTSATVSAGVLTTVLQTYNNWPLEEIDTSATVTAGVLTTVLQTYNNWPLETIDVSATITSGVLT